MSVTLNGATSGALADVDTNSEALRTSMYGPNGSLAYRRSDDVRTAEGLLVGGNNDGNFRRLRVDRLGGLASAAVTPMLFEPFEGATLSASRLVAVATTMAAAQTAAGGLVINSGNITTVNTGYSISTRKLFPRYLRAPIQGKTRVRVEHYPNSVIEFGFGFGQTQVAPPTVGAYIQFTASGVVQGVLTFNGTDVTVPLTGWAPDTTAKFYTCDVIMDDDAATFVVQDTATGLILSDVTVPLAIAQPRLANVTHLPYFYSVRNTAVAPVTAPRLHITDLAVGLLDTFMNTPWADRAAQMGAGANYNPLTFAQASQAANNATPANATLSNTTAGYTTVGGRFAFAAIAGGLTDYSLFSFTVPAPYQFVCKGITIETSNVGAAVATTPTLLDWSVGVNGASANLATGGHIRDFVGMQSLPIGAAIGAKAERIQEKFDTALVCEAGLTMSLILRMPVGTATASQVIQGGVKFHGLME